MGNEQYLKPAKPGEIRNPKGKPKGTKNMATVIREILDTKLTLKEHPITKKAGVKMTVREMITLAMVKEAQQGNVSAYKELTDRLEGKVKDKLDLEVSQKLLTLKPFGPDDKGEPDAGNGGLLPISQLQPEADGGAGGAGEI